MSKVKVEKTPPSPKRLIESLRGLGYSFETAVADILDNSISADATEIHVNIRPKEGATPGHITITDNGHGMDRTELKEAMRYGSDVSYSIEELGKFGLGLKTASLSQCGTLTVSSKKKQTKGKRSRKYIAQWDLKHVYKQKEWELLFPEKDQVKTWEQDVLANDYDFEHGTVVLWTGFRDELKNLDGDNLKKRQTLRADLIEDLSNYLSGAFHMFMEGKVPSKSKVKIFVEGVELTPWDPFCSKESKSESISPYKPKPSEIGTGIKSKVVFKPYFLPTESDFSSPQAFKEAGGIKGWNAQQGFYFYRNHRLIQSGGWSRMRKPDEHLKLLRIAVMFSGEHDEAFNINVTKMTCSIPQGIRQEIKNLVYRGSWSSKADKKYRKKTKTKTSSSQASRSSKATKKKTTKSPVLSTLKVGPITIQPSNTRSGQIAVSQSGSGIKFIIPQNHELSNTFSGDTDEVSQLAWVLIGILECVNSGKLKAKDIPIETLRRKLRKLT